MAKIIVLTLLCMAHITAAQSGRIKFSHRDHLKQFEKLGITCTDCHHFDIKSRRFTPLDPNVPKRFIRARPKICLECHGAAPGSSFANQCRVCHAEKVTAGNNHPGEPGITCRQCHVPIDFSHRSLAFQNGAKCLECHAVQKFHHRDVLQLASTGPARGLIFDRGQLACLTCHQMHLSERAPKFLRTPGVVKNFCTACHGKKSDGLYSEFHKKMKN